MAVTPCVMVAADDVAIYAAVEELNRTGLARTVRTEVVDGTRVTHLDVPWQPCRNLANPGAATRLGLDVRDVRILSLLAEGFRCGEIGNLIGITVDVVKARLKYIYRQLRARDQAHAVAIACRVGILGGTA
jgi:DNA-binding NarL/FixJ family response regulator